MLSYNLRWVLKMNEKTNILLRLSIEEEQSGKQYGCSEGDKDLLRVMISEINSCLGTNLHYLAELDHYHIKGSGEIVSKYIQSFQSESLKAYLIPQISLDKTRDCDLLIYQLYMHFRVSDEYIAKQGKPSPAHIYVRYDNAFRRLKPKRLKAELLALSYNPRDAFYLPLTMRMLASWKLPAMEEILLSYLDGSKITDESVGLPSGAENCFPRLSSFQRELKFTAIEGLKYYPTGRNVELIRMYSNNPDKDISMAAKKSYKYLEKHGF